MSWLLFSTLMTSVGLVVSSQKSDPLVFRQFIRRFGQKSRPNGIGKR